MWIKRVLVEDLKKYINSRPALLLSGVRQAGKSSLLRKVFPDAVYVTLDRPQYEIEARENPSFFLQRFEGVDRVILDEVQYAPGLFRELKVVIDENREAKGKWILTGSQKFMLMKNASESLAGRISMFFLETMSADELRQSGFFDDVSDVVWKGGYPELWAHQDIDPVHYYDDYIRTYLERDLRDILQVVNLRDFQRFLRACAIRVGQLINYTDIAKDVGVSPNTIKSWLQTLETSGVIVLLQPYYANIGKRLVKAPKLFFADQGLLCSLLNITSMYEVFTHIYSGNLWENFVFTELLKTRGLSPDKNMFFYRDQNNVEIDFVLELHNKLYFIEAKSAEMINNKKLNFKKVAGLVPQQTVHIVACRIQEKTRFKLKDYDMLNPVHCNILEF